MSSAGVEKEKKSALVFRVDGESSECPARASTVGLPHGDVDTPMFMPVGTYGTVKGTDSDVVVSGGGGREVERCVLAENAVVLRVVGLVQV